MLELFVFMFYLDGVFRYIHPVNGNECSVVIGGDYITTESGTGLVHTAPGHGQEDYITGLKYGLPIFFFPWITKGTSLLKLGNSMVHLSWELVMLQL